jgi:hypothetical protein
MKRNWIAAARALWLGLASSLAPAPSFAAQGSLVMQTTGTVSGLTLVNDINAALEALVTCNSGTTAPTNSADNPSTHQLWCDNSVNPNRPRIDDGTNWDVVGRIDPTNHLWVPTLGTGMVASASTTDLCSVNPAYVSTTGTTAITSFSNTCQPGQSKFITFAGALTLTYNATAVRNDKPNQP